MAFWSNMADTDVNGEGEGADKQVCGQCGESFTIEQGKYRLQDHCHKCSSRSRSVCNSTQDKNVVEWFRGLRKSDPEQYRKILSDADAKIKTTQSGEPGSKLGKDNFNLARYREASWLVKQLGHGLQWYWCLLVMGT